MSKNPRFEIVKLDELFVAGLALRTNNKTEQELGKKGWISTTWPEVHQINDPNAGIAVYTGYSGDKDDNFTVVIGTRRASAEDFESGEVLTRVPAGTYAKFSRTGAVPEVVVEAWQDVWQAEDDGALARAYTADLEVYVGDDMSNLTVELYIAISD